MMNPVTAFDFRVYLVDDKPFSEFSPRDALGFGLGVAAQTIMGGFAEVSGLNAELEVEEYREGGWNSGPRKFMKWGRYPNVTLKRGVSLSPDLWDWYYAVTFKSKRPKRKNGLILLLDRNGGLSQGGGAGLALPFIDRMPVAAWFFQGALPERLHGPQLNAKSNEIAIETLELSHQGLVRLGPSMVPGLGDITDAMGI